ncbi:MAG: dihydropteroate synthase [Phycisphaerales bacterium]
MPATAPSWSPSSRKRLDLAAPVLCAIINTTPDSFSDGGLLTDPSRAADHALAALASGASMLDLGAESTRPGAARISAADQRARLLPVLRAVRHAIGDATPISIDTTLAPVAAAALDEGADAINDVSAATEDPAMLPLAAGRQCGIVLMHRLVPPGSDHYSHSYAASPAYAHVVEDVRAFLALRTRAALDAGLAPDRLVIDPGLGFGKSVEQNLALITGTPRLLDLGFPVLSGLSRKSFVAIASGLPKDSPPAGRLAGTIALTLAHAAAGARILRVHDVAPIAQALAAWHAVSTPSQREGAGGGRFLGAAFP